MEDTQERLLTGWLLKYMKPEVEAQYLKLQVQRFSEASRLLAIPAGCAALSAIPLAAQRMGGVQRSTEARRVNDICGLVLSVLIALLTVFFIYAWASCRMRVRPAIHEMATTFFMTFVMVICCMADKYYCAKLIGHDPVVIFKSQDVEKLSFSDSGVLLGIILCVMAPNLILPIRGMILMFLNVSAIIWYLSLAMALGSSEPPFAVSSNTIVLISVIAVTCIAQRKMEVAERKLFAKEYTAQTRCSQMSSDSSRAAVMNVIESNIQPVKTNKQDVNLETSASVDYSLPETSENGRIFQALGNDSPSNELLEQLNAIDELGKKEKWLVNGDNLVVFPTRIIGRGTFGIVVAGTLSGTPVALKGARFAKYSSSSSSSSSSSYLQELSNELRILRHVHHPNIVSFHGACVELSCRDLILILEFVEGQSMQQYIAEGCDFGVRKGCMPTNTDRYALMRDICMALRYLHSQRPHIVHGDLKASNIMVEQLMSMPRAKLVDFGLSRVLTKHAKPLGGTLDWMAPEVMGRRNPGPQADVFSFGRLLFFLSTGLKPLASLTSKMIITLTLSGNVPEMQWPNSSILAEQCRALATRCTLYHSSERPEMAAVHTVLATWPDLLISKDEHFNVFRHKSLSSIPISHETSSGCTGQSWHESFGMVRQAVGVSEGHGATQKKPKKHVTKGPVNNQSQQTLCISIPATDSKQNRGDTPTNPQATTSEARTLNRVVNGLAVTPRNTILLTLIATMLQWNYPVPDDTCCTYHAALKLLISVARDMQMQRCNMDFGLGDCGQCPDCGILHINEDGNMHFTCDVCG